MKKFDLNIQKVLEDWQVYHAIREIIANALDETILAKTKKDIEIYKEGENWHIRDYGRGLKYEHLTQNESEEKQLCPEKIIGKFGVGLKDAFATFDRHNVGVKIISRYGIITLGKSSKSDFEDITTLHAFVDDSFNNEFLGTDFILSNVNDNNIQQAKQFFLRFSNETVLEKNLYGEVLKKNGKSLIYLNGLKIAEEDNFLFSYNITSINSKIRKSLNRERTNVGRSAYSDRVKSILLECKSNNVLMPIVEDLKEFENGKCHDELSWLDVKVHACKILNNTEKQVFVTPQEIINNPTYIDRIKSSNYNIITIPEDVKAKIAGQTDNTGKNIVDLDEFVEQWNDSFEYKFVNMWTLNIEEKKIFDKRYKILALANFKLPQDWSIVVSENIRSTISYEPLGICERELKKIIIKRSQLASIEQFAATLLHEIIHCVTDSSDMSIKFENELTKLIGYLTAKQIEKKSFWRIFS